MKFLVLLRFLSIIPLMFLSNIISLILNPFWLIGFALDITILRKLSRIHHTLDCYCNDLVFATVYKKQEIIDLDKIKGDKS